MRCLPICSNPQCNHQTCILKCHQAGVSLLKLKFLNSNHNQLRGLLLRIACSWKAKTLQDLANSQISLELLSTVNLILQLNHGQYLNRSQWLNLLSNNLLSHQKPQTTSSIKVQCAILQCLDLKLMLLVLLALAYQKRQRTSQNLPPSLLLLHSLPSRRSLSLSPLMSLSMVINLQRSIYQMFSLRPTMKSSNKLAPLLVIRLIPPIVNCARSFS